MWTIARFIASRARAAFRTCRFCGYRGSDWPDSGECPSCGETN